MNADALLLAVVAALGEQAIDSDQQSCAFQHRGRSVRLRWCEGAAGAHVMGRMQIDQVIPDRDPQKILLSMYLNAGLHEVLNFPMWVGLDPDDDALCLFFGTAAGTADATVAGSIASMIAEASDLASRDGFLQSEGSLAASASA